MPPQDSQRTKHYLSFPDRRTYYHQAQQNSIGTIPRMKGEIRSMRVERDAEQDHHMHLKPLTVELAANRAIMLGREAQIAERGERKIRAYDQGYQGFG